MSTDGTMPFLAERFTPARKFALGTQQQKALYECVPDGVEAGLRRFYYETALATHPAPLSALLKLIPVSQVDLGTDYPYRHCIENVQGLAAYGFAPTDIAAIEHDNAARLMPRYG
jgi:6-methylsalicylate decarboxylase